MSKARNLSKVIVDSSGIVDRDSLDVETVAKTGSYNDLTNKPTIPSGTVTSVAASAGTGISVSGSPITSSGTITITNTAPDKTVALTAGTGISTSGTYPNFTITNSAPDQTVALTQSGTTTITGTYPNFTISSADQYVGTVTSVAATVPTGLAVSGTPVTSSGTLAITYASGYSIPTDAKQTNWDTAYGWGDHSTEGYLTSYTETDPVFIASEAASITSTDTSNWDTAYGWGNHASAGYLTSYTETDPVYTASSWYSTTNNASNWDTAYGWGNHASAGYASYPSQTGNTGKYLTTDGTSTSWDALATVANSGSYNDLTDKPTLTTNLDGLTDVVITSPASDQVLKYNGTNWVNGTGGGGGGGVTSLTGTANEIDVSASTGSVTISLPATINADLNGNAATATSSNSASAKWTSAAIAGSQSGNTSALEVRNNSGTGDANLANITFHCQGAYGTSLHLRPDGYFGVGGWSASTWRWYTNLTTGDMVAAGNVTAYSDERLKKDWALVGSNFVERLSQIKSGTYTRIDTSERQAGVSAQDMQKLLPEVVNVGADDEKTLSLAYGNAALVAAIELAKQVVELKKEIELLKAR